MPRHLPLRPFLSLFACAALLAPIPQAAHAAGARPAAQAGLEAPAPQLVVVMVIDGLPAEQLQRYRGQFGQGGLRRLMEQGASFTNAHQAHGITVTAIGHSAVLSGAYPYRHGIIGNNWIDANGKLVYCTEDARYHYIGEETDEHDGTSPARLRVDTLGDQLRYASGNRSKVVTVSGKDRGAILLAGKTGTAYMYMDKTGDFASSTYYMQQHPAWAERFRAAKPKDRYYAKSWKPLLPDSAYADDAPFPEPSLKSPNRFPFSFYSNSGNIDGDYFNRLKTSPYLDELTLEFARAAVEGERLGGTPGVTDLLGVSLSAHDYVNHAYGPESRMSHDHLQRLDRMLADFFTYLDRKLGAGNVLVVLTADHGFPNTPEFVKANKGDAGRVDSAKLTVALNAALAAKFGPEKLAIAQSAPNWHLDYAAIDKLGMARVEVENAAAAFLRTQDGVAEVFTRSQFEADALGATRMGLLMRRAWNRELSGDLVVINKPNWYFSSGSSGTSHGSPYAYDTNVPLLISGRKWIKPGYYGQYAETVDIAPTLAHLLRLRPPAGSEGRVLVEALHTP